MVTRISKLIRKDLNLRWVQVFIIIFHRCYLKICKLVIEILHIVCLNKAFAVTQVFYLPECIDYLMQIKLFESCFVPSSVGVEVFESLIETFDYKFTAALRKYQVEENMMVSLKKLLTNEYAGVSVSHKKFIN